MKKKQVRLWFAFPDEIADPVVLREYEKLLTDGERARKDRFRFPEHRRRFLVTRALVRVVLSGCAGTEPDQLRFSVNRYGKPEIVESMNAAGVRFNVSHTDGLIVCGLALKSDIGVDVENPGRRSETSMIAERFFSSSEVDDLNRVPAEARRQRFFRYWTLKESYIKARGMGLSLPLDQFSFHLPEKGPVGISFGPGIEDDPGRWRFWLLEAPPGYPVAVSVGANDRERYELLTGKTVPLVDKAPFDCEVIHAS